MTAIEQYIVSCPAQHRAKLTRLREIILRAAPELREKIAYGVPTFYLKKNVIHFSLAKTHIGVYPGAEAIVHFAQRLAAYDTAKGTVRLPLDAPLPEELIADIVKWNLK